LLRTVQEGACLDLLASLRFARKAGDLGPWADSDQNAL